MRLAYLVGTYPAVSHTFIAREVEELRGRGVDVYTFSVRRPGADQLLDDADRRRAAETPSIQPPDWTALLLAHARALSRSPGRWLATLRLAVSLSPGGARATLWQAFYFVEAILVWDWCRQRRVGHLHAHFADSGCWIAMLAAAFGGETLGFSFTMHGPTEFDDVHAYRLTEKVQRAAFVICISDFCRSQLMKLSPPSEWRKLRIVHCGLDLDRYRPPAPDLVRDGVGGSGALRILCVGRLVAAKGQHLLIDAVARLRADGLDATLELVGDGPERAALQRAVATHGLATSVTLHGSLPPADVRAQLARCQVFCLPSFSEGVPVVLMEAMAMERPVIATWVMGVPELVHDERDGLLVAPGEVRQLTTALRRLAGDPALRGRLGRAGRVTVAAGYALSAEVDQLLASFAEVA
jgi:glycosyltransferase involved in cell wall biosynthesis